jgi:hypothetical protein
MNTENTKKPNKYKVLIFKNIVFLSSLVLNFSWFFIIALGLDGFNIYASTYTLLYLISYTLAPSFISSILIILSKNNSPQDWVSGISYDENVRFKLIIRTFLKHVCAALFYILTSIALTLGLNKLSTDGVLILSILTLPLIIIDTIIVVKSSTYTSVFNILLGIKK